MLSIRVSSWQGLRDSGSHTSEARTRVLTCYTGGLKLAKWRKLVPAVAASLEEAGEELLTFDDFPAAQHKSLRTTSAIERLQQEFRRRVKTQASLPSEKAVLLLFFALFASGQIKLHRIAGWWNLAQTRAQAPHEGNRWLLRRECAIYFSTEIGAPSIGILETRKHISDSIQLPAT